MLHRLRTKHPVLYCLLAEVLFLAVLQLGSLAVVALTVLVQVIAQNFGLWLEPDLYMLSFLGELPGIALAWVLLWRTRRTKLIRRRGSGFFNGLLVGMYPIGILAYSLMSSIFSMPADAQLHTAWSIFWFIMSMFSVGVAEEFVGRGVIAQTLLEHYGTSRAGVWKACIVSGLFFGAGHLINLLSVEPFGVLMQCLIAVALGAMFAAVYFRTGNIWVTVFIHTLMDVVALWEGGVYGSQTMADAVSGYSVVNLLTAVIYGLPMLYLLRKKKLPEVRLYFGRDCAALQAEKRELSAEPELPAEK